MGIFYYLCFIMTTFLYFIGFLIAGLLIGALRLSISSSKRKKLTSTWEVGDVIILDMSYVSLGLEQYLQKHNGKNAVKLSGWNENNIIYEFQNKVFIEDWKSLKTNKSDYWRTQHNNCQEYMGKVPSFTPIVTDIVESSTSNSDMVDGQPIETLSETMCEIYLKKAIKDENYEMADKLRKRMERFR